MAERPTRDFGRRPPVVPPGPPAPPSKRSRNVALLLMGTVAVGGSAYALMPSEHCQPNQPGVTAAPGQPTSCASRGSSSSGGHGYSSGSSSRSNFYGGDSSSSGSSSSSNTGHVARGGFGAFASGVAAHFSGGG